jgi:hypothetical protein
MVFAGPLLSIFYETDLKLKFESAIARVVAEKRRSDL